MKYVDDEATQKRFYEALLKLPWLAPEVRNAIMRELGRSPREEDVRTEKARTGTLRHEVSEVEARMRANGERPPRGDIHTAAVEEVAGTADMKPEALMKRIQRLRGEYQGAGHEIFRVLTAHIENLLSFLRNRHCWLQFRSVWIHG